MFGIGGTELLIIAVFILVIFGPDKMPEIARQVGRAWGTFKRAQEDMERVIRAEVYAPSSTSATSADKTSPETSATKPAEPPAAAIWAAADEDDEEGDEE